MKTLMTMWLVICGAVASAILVYGLHAGSNLLLVFANLSVLGLIVGVVATFSVWITKHRRGGVGSDNR